MVGFCLFSYAVHQQANGLIEMSILQHLIWVYTVSSGTDVWMFWSNAVYALSPFSEKKKTKNTRFVLVTSYTYQSQSFSNKVKSKNTEPSKQWINKYFFFFFLQFNNLF